uniref:CSON008766 protein n=1 Tax=Culicoides sonorensis TaxID=179676 RepID=A0A336LFW1_CULSO
MDKAAQDNRANQINPNNQGRPAKSGDPSNRDNRANQLNPNNPQPKSQK